MKCGVGPIRREHCVGNSLYGVLIVIETGGAEGEVEIDDDGIQRQVARDRPGHVVRDGGRADAALGADDGDDQADRNILRRREQVADRAYDIERLDRPDDVVVDAAAYQFAIGRNIVPSPITTTRSGIADGREFIEAGKDVDAGFGFQNDHVRRRRSVIGIDGGCDAAMRT